MMLVICTKHWYRVESWQYLGYLVVLVLPTSCWKLIDVYAYFIKNLVLCWFIVSWKQIRKMYTYCASFSHSAVNCQIRESRIYWSASKNRNNQQILFDVHGPWMTQICEISIHQVDAQSNSTATNIAPVTSSALELKATLCCLLLVLLRVP
jgi:hypothetical protein